MPRGSVSRWIHALKNGDESAAQPLWERYHARLIGLARQKLSKAARRSADAEEVTQVAFGSFFQGIAGGRFPDLDDRFDLWRLLVVITARNAIDQVRRELRDGKQNVTPDSPAAMTIVETDTETTFEQIIGHEPTPALAAELVEQYENLLKRLDDETLQQVAVWKLEGFTNGEIGEKLECSRRTVIRKLETIRLIWSEEPD